MKNRYIVIMAGGIGTRFWPLSRGSKPKQFLDILNSGSTLLKDTITRFKGLCPPENIIVVTSEEHAEMVKEQIDIPDENILAEPMRRNTAPCIAYAAYTLYKRNPEALMVISPADHHIKDVKKFRKAIIDGFEFVSTREALLTLGIIPDRPETGYGYIQANMKVPVEGFAGVTKVKTFTEKPDRDLAQVFLDSGDFFWNSGIFIWQAKEIISSFEEHLPDIFATFEEYKDSIGGANEDKIIGRVYSECPSISIDYGIMEKADNVYVRRTDFGWSDLGTWGSLPGHLQTDENNNCGDIENLFDYEMSNNIVKLPKDKVAVIQGLDNYIIVDTDNVLMIIKREEEQNIKKYIDDIEEKIGKSYQ
jgi:mannose-1-phosphate guanylyltransferase